MPENNILYTTWRAPEEKAVLLLVHGFGAHSQRWEAFAEFFLREKISSYAIELKGFGETKTAKGDIDSFNVYLEDVLALGRIISKENPNVKIFLIGESMGGLISFLLAAKEPRPFRGLVCISPAFTVILRLSLVKALGIFFASFFSPHKRFDVPFAPELCTRDKTYQASLESDKREIRFATARFIRSMFTSGLRAKRLAKKITLPSLFLVAGDDKMVSAKTTKKLFPALRSNDKTIIEYPEMRHALSIELGKEKVFADIAKWIKDRI